MNPNAPISDCDRVSPQSQASSLATSGKRDECQNTQYPPHSLSEPLASSGINLDPANVQSVLSSDEGSDRLQSGNTTGQTEGGNDRGGYPTESEILPLKLPDISKEREYLALLRSLRRHRGFGIYFVSCVPAQQKQIVQQVRQDLPERQVGVLTFEQAVERKTAYGVEKGNFYGVVKDFLQEQGKVDILFVRGLEYSFFDYEDTKKQSSGWTSEDIYSYSWKGVPPILINLNQQRELFRDRFDVCFVFLVRPFVIKYFINRAPDFFDWRSGLFKLPIPKEVFEQSYKTVVEDGDIDSCFKLSLQDEKLPLRESNQQLSEIEDLLKANPPLDRKIQLCFKRGERFEASEDYEAAISNYDHVLELNAHDEFAQFRKACALFHLWRYEAALENYDRSINLNTMNKMAWYGRSNALLLLERHSEASDSAKVGVKTEVLAKSPNDVDAWFERGLTLENLKLYQEAISSYTKALVINSNQSDFWFHQGYCLGQLGKDEEAIASYDKAIELNPNSWRSWNNRGIALRNLRCYKDRVNAS
jgi:tetratricopeptide (TPR) repeat protein